MNAKRIALIVTGSLAALLASALLIGGGLALYGNSQKDSDGYLSTDTHRFEAGTRALATENLDLDLGDADEFVQTNDLGDVRVQVDSRGEKPVFVGIARTSDVESYLSGVSHTTLTDVESTPFDADYDDHAGSGRPVAPADSNIWAASEQGSGKQTLKWEIEDGDWSVVVMNADGSPGVHAGVTAGASMPFLTAAGWTALGGGLLLVLGTAGLVALALRPRREWSAPVVPQPEPEPAG